MGLTKKLHITINHDEADSYYQHAKALQDYLLKVADTKLFARYWRASNKTDAPTVLRKMEMVLRDADPRITPGVLTAGSNVSATEFLVSFELAAMDALGFPFRFVLDRELLRAGMANEPRKILGEEAYVTLGRLAEKLATADPRILRVVYETPGPLISLDDKHRAPKTPAGNNEH